MASSVVIKVQYGKTLRRFNALVKEDQHLELNMEELRMKIRSLFHFLPDADFSLTYIDEDDDQVTLVDDEDLHDVMKQGLNPVRITVHLKAKKEGNSSGSQPSGNSSSLQTASQNVAEVLKSVPDPLCAALSKLSIDLASKAASSAPGIADLINNLSRIGQSSLNAPHSPTGSNTSNHDGCETSINGEMKSNGVGAAEATSKSSQTANVVPPLLPNPLLPLRGKDAQHYAGNSSIKRDATNLLRAHLYSELEKDDKGIIGDRSLKSGVNLSDRLKVRQDKCPSYPKETTEATHLKNRQFNFGGTSATKAECPFSGIPLPPRVEEGHIPPPSQNHDIQNLMNNAEGMGSIFHKGVRCDGCGVLPITGPRFKSKVKHNFDLCIICFTRMGNDTDYNRFDFPLPYRHPWAGTLNGFYDPMVTRQIPLQSISSVMRPVMEKQFRPRLDSRFIMDVNVMDGTLMAPSTAFTKIWRMRNSGNLPWSRGLQLLWIGGDRFTASDSVEIEVPVDGVKVGNEIDIAVDFTAPELPGRYISYWRMAEPSGHKFGQRVWVLIQVNATLSDSTYESTPSLNLNLPPESTGIMASPVVNVELPSSVIDQKRKTEIGDLNFPINNDLLVGSDDVSLSCATSPRASSSAANIQPASAPPSPSDLAISITCMSDPPNVEDDKRNPEQNKGGNEQEERLLKELEVMGFKKVDLNIEVLRMNEYDLERSVDELCGVSEWDPILEELKEMGFHDKETNKKLLVKNNGSIMRVVMDLIAGENA